MDTAGDINGPRPETRAELRTNLFALATISAGTAAGPVKVRNLSQGGAMVEGASLPSTGEAVELRRGAACVRGEVAWCDGGRAGLRFAGRVDVADWLPGGHAGQQRVDQVFQQFQSAPAAESALPASLSSLDPALAPAQLRRLSRDIESLADEIAGDISVVTRFATKLQVLDLASQILRKLADQQAK